MNLARQQQQLLEALWHPQHLDAMQLIADGALVERAAGRNGWERGLKAYRSQAQALAVRALGAAYPVVAQLLGEENFEPLARSLWLRHPPARGDMAQWGAEFAAHMASLPGLVAEEPYLPDVARTEWALHAIATACDAQRDPASFSLLAQGDPAGLTLVLSPGACCVESRHPVVSIVSAHLEGQPTLQEAGERLRAGVSESAVVWRQGFKPRLRQALPGEAAFIAALQEKRFLADSLEAAQGLDFNAWLVLAVQQGLVLAVREP